MDEQSKKAAEEQAKNTEGAKEGKKPEEKQEETIADALETKKKEQKLVPEAVLLEYKNANKELKRDLKELKQLIESGATKKEISSDIKALADEHNVDPDFLQKFAAAIKKSTEEEISAKVKPFEEKERQEKINTLFEDHFKKAIEKMPEYKDVVNKDVIKTLSLNPANQNKTFTQIIEEAFGHLIKGKKTLESSSPSGKEESQDVDFDKAVKDAKYFSEIMANPLLKEKYNKGLAERLKL